jgi:hypothetical protein
VDSVSPNPKEIKKKGINIPFPASLCVYVYVSEQANEGRRTESNKEINA